MKPRLGLMSGIALPAAATALVFSGAPSRRGAAVSPQSSYVFAPVHPVLARNTIRQGATAIRNDLFGSPEPKPAPKPTPVAQPDPPLPTPDPLADWTYTGLVTLDGRQYAL